MRFETLRPPFVLLGMVALLCAVLHAEEDELANYLANQCEISSVLPAENYQDYCRKLAITMRTLSGQQQDMIFGMEGHNATNPSGNTSAGGEIRW